MSKQRKMIGVVGQAGYGKSFLSNKLSQKFERVFLLDSDEDFSGKVCYNFEQVKRYFDIVGYGNEIKFRIVCRFENTNELNKIFDFAWSMEKCCIVCDEFEYFIEHNTDEFIRIMFQGRHREVSMILIGQRFVQFPAKLRSTFTSFISFYQNEPLDLERAESYGFNPAIINKLEKYKYEIVGEKII